MQRKFFTLQNKLDIIQYAREHSKKQAALEYGIQAKQIRDWEAKEEEMRGIPESKRSKLFTLHLGATVKCEEAERLLADWHREVVTVRNHGVTILMLMEKLKEFCDDYDEMNETALRAKISRFMGRHNLVLRRVNSYQAIPSDELQPVIDTFSQDVRDFIGLHDMDLSQIYNMDQTAIFFDMPPTYTVVQKGEQKE